MLLRFSPDRQVFNITSEHALAKGPCNWSLKSIPYFIPSCKGRLTMISVTFNSLARSNNYKRRCNCYDLFDQQIPYLDAWRWQRSMVDASATAMLEGSDEEDTVVILQHPPVYTMGTRSSDKFLRFDKENPPYELYITERGGEVTYHGPGQLVMYPILNLRKYKMDLHWYLRSLEEVVIRALRTSCSLQASRVEGLTGVWVGDQKVAAIGVRVSRWITYHGLALNVTADLAPFRHIIPCGISDRQVGSVLELLKARSALHALHVEWKQEAGLPNLEDCYLDPHCLLDLLHCSLLQAFSDVFGVDLLRARKDTLGRFFQ